MKIKVIELWKWFPANDPFATKMARLCVLREDFAFELQSAVESKSVPIEDEYGNDWRFIYFFRKMNNTVQEIRSVIESLAKDKEFKQFLKSQSNDLKGTFKNLQKDLNSAFDTIKNIRNDVGAHVQEEPVGSALSSMSHERSGFFQISNYKPSKTHYKFTKELIMAVMFRDIPDDQQLDNAKELRDLFINAIENILYAIDSIFYAYAHDRKLM